MSRFASAALVLTLCGAGLAHAQAPVSTAGAAAAPPAAALDTATQIEDFIRTAPAPVLDDGKPNGVTTSEEEPRKMHGEVGVAVGSGGYRSGYAISVMPVGKTGTLSLAVSETRSGKNGGVYGGPGYGYGYGGPRGFSPFGGERRSVGLSLALGDAAQDDCKVRRSGFQPYDLDGQPGLEHPRCRERDANR
jgi:hypothetical protein